MLTLTEQEVLDKIQNLVPFEAQLDDGSLTIRITEYQPYVATAIHHGHRLRDDLAAKCALTESERYFEEDPHTGDFISSLPIVFQGEDSRYEYDLNRAPNNCVYEQAWGKEVWTSPLSTLERVHSERKHARYYRIIKCMVETLEKEFGICLLYDLHSYNYQRIEKLAPTFNVGTKQVNTRRWHKAINDFISRLGGIALPNLEVIASENDVFQGMGYQATFIKQHFTKTLILPLEIKKIYMDEARGESYPLVIEKLKEGLKTVISEHAAFTLRNTSGAKKITRGHILSSKLPSEVRKVDRQLYSLAKGLNTLNYINPTNLRQEKRRFLTKPYTYQPHFTYRQLDIDPYLFREKLYRLPVDDIRDADIQKLYRKVIDQLAVRIDLLTSIGHEEFLYNSLRYYGQPDDQDIANAKFIMHAAEYEELEPYDLTPSEVMAEFRQAADEYGFSCKVIGSNKLIARAMVSGKTLKVNTNVMFGRKDLNALIHHEMGVHMVTSINAEKQPLQILKLGFPGNTHTQEGLAILCEHLSGSFSLSRLKTLALRVIAVNMMVKGETFGETFHTLKHDYKLSDDNAFTVAARAYRGGGFTKDYLYLKGLRDALNCHHNEDLTALFLGKTSFEFKPLLDELIAREILHKPDFLPKALDIKRKDDPVLDYMMHSIK
ncbi:flavohemoglobin expression-modulating QEGLA motif protein [Photobacterium sp.]|uniref:flavohemoglobin expression-modulating QEGLA motif protein n=1 Tax=Photobacterium sp. TaxID=660 RepID=UPI00299D3A2F|nr:flavohemoglobin expression-modulating QEGLA motif protein [Photobacterium sp.]MDX1301275.1 flavohemoglobin expression-modulating QEGLA motif protein [Photobacterium sp.]